MGFGCRSDGHNNHRLKSVVKKLKMKHPISLNKHVYHELYYHLIWTTKDRQDLITNDIELLLYRMIREETKKLWVQLISIGGIENHIHLLIRCAPNHFIPDIVKQLKGSSSHFINHELKPGFHFNWQRGYGILSVSVWNLQKIIEYIVNQKIHHQTGKILKVLERINFLNQEY